MIYPLRPSISHHEVRANEDFIWFKTEAVDLTAGEVFTLKCNVNYRIPLNIEVMSYYNNNIKQFHLSL